VLYRPLGSTGLQISVIGFGASPLGNEFGSIEPADAERSVHAAIDCGINLFDVAPYYGRTLAETRLGSALVSKRNKVVLATKCGRYDKDSFDFSQQRVITSVDESLRRLQTDYLDLLTAHDIEFGDREQILSETLPAMRKLQRQGKVRFIGVSGLPLRMLADVARRGDLDYVLSYCHYNMLSRDLDQVLRPVTQARNIGLLNASPLYMGALTESGPPEWHPAATAVRQAAAQVVSLCRARRVNPSVLALRFCIDYPYAASTLVGMSHPRQVEQNVSALQFQLDTNLLEEVDRIVAPVRDATWPSGCPENSDV